MEDVYRQLARHLDRLPAGFPATDSGVELRILARLFTPEEAATALGLTLMPEPPEAVAQRLGVEVVRGSSSRDGAKGLLEMVRECDKSHLVMTPDGPTAVGGGEIVKLLKTGSAYYAPAGAVVDMARAVLLDEKKILPASAYLEGEYGINDLFIGVPVKLGAKGMEQVIEITLTEAESAALQRSADAVRTLVADMKRLGGTS